MLTTEVIQGQLADWSDVAVPLDVAPSTWQLMQWEESGAAEQLLTQPCSTVIASEIKEVKQPPNGQTVDNTSGFTVQSFCSFPALCSDGFPGEPCLEWRH